MAVEFSIRDLLWPRRTILNEVGIGPGMRVLDYGCGPGSYVLPAAQMVGETGRVYALDMHPLALASVRRLCARKRLTNVTTILSDCNTGLGESEVDVALLYDVLHDVENRGPLLRELHRVLKPQGLLSASDHHLKGQRLATLLTEQCLFRLLRKGRWAYDFVPVDI
ncbi:MAG: class I SAM-dependent methyltransferase [Armatimonadota bacterium]|nr:MAG: class I SAM-dependent methyltransferase [Armatimonadota bacterium]